MTNTLTLIKALDNNPSPHRGKGFKSKPRGLRRQETRDTAKANGQRKTA